ncbi:fibropellin-1-like [Watersipora subatra]|uniref:fibropellin-1-like n=1 Tax=Watersipora subatra TaxID=2589382 RepID=UPI00355B7DC1
MDQVDGYGCLCTEDFHGKFCQYRIDNCQGVPCHNNGLCVDGVNDYSCLCSPGYTGRNCALQIDPCVNITCKNGGTCLGLSTKLFICSCPSGYSGIYCEEDLSVCNTRQPCGELATCFDGRGDEYMCICPPGETPVVNSGLMSCKDTVDSCASHPCLEGATCIDTRLGYECHCPTGTSGARCQYNPDDCQTKPCNNGGTCKDGFNSFECRCPLGFSGTQCEIDIRNEFCSKQCNIKNTANCSFDGGKITCICIQGFMGERCQHRMLQCTSNPCKHGICTEKSIGYKCGCEAGWTGYNCDTRIALCPSVDCGPHGSCLETDTGPQCFCQTDYTGIYCETRIDPCVGIVCKNGGICVAVYEQYEPWVCNCSSDIYIGKYCEYELAVSAIAQSQQMPDPILDTCSNFWTISPELRKAILIISIAANFTILALGLIIIQMCVRSARLRLSRKLNESARYYNSTRSFPPYRMRY